MVGRRTRADVRSPVSRGAILVAHDASAEAGCFLRLGWDPSSYCWIDTYAEFRCPTNDDHRGPPQEHLSTGVLRKGVVLEGVVLQTDVEPAKLLEVGEPAQRLVPASQDAGGTHADGGREQYGSLGHGKLRRVEGFEDVIDRQGSAHRVADQHEGKSRPRTRTSITRTTPAAIRSKTRASQRTGRPIAHPGPGRGDHPAKARRQSAAGLYSCRKS